MFYYAKNLAEITAICNWMNERLPNPEAWREPYAVAVLEDDPPPDRPRKIYAAAVYTNYSGNNIFLSGAIDKEGIGKVQRGDLRAMLGLAFEHPLNCSRITALVSETNKRSQKFMRQLGFKEEGRLRDYLDTGTITILYGMTRADFSEARICQVEKAAVAPSRIMSSSSGTQPITTASAN